jgi:hypothetical protein
LSTALGSGILRRSGPHHGASKSFNVGHVQHRTTLWILGVIVNGVPRLVEKAGWQYLCASWFDCRGPGDAADDRSRWEFSGVGQRDRYRPGSLRGPDPSSGSDLAHQDARLGEEVEVRGGSLPGPASAGKRGPETAISRPTWPPSGPHVSGPMYLDLGARGHQTEFHLNFMGADNWAPLWPPGRHCLINPGRSLYVARSRIFRLSSSKWRPTLSRPIPLDAGYRPPPFKQLADCRRGHCK